MTMPFRQIHLDFHTGEHIPEVGQDFDAERFVAAFKRAHVQSVTLFATCHHGWAYFDTKVGQRHPSLKFNLLRAQYDALKAAGIRVPIYVTGAWNELVAREHPEWRVITEDGKFLYASGNTGSLEVVRWALLDFSTPYMDHLEAQIREVAAAFPDCDGIFHDIGHQYPSCSPSALKQMGELGLDWTSGADRLKHAAIAKQAYLERTTAASKSTNPNVPVFHNHGNVTLGDRSILNYDSHLEVESLPTGGWGYDHFPIGAKYSEIMGADFSGMTGKFHTTWGEFGAFKHPDALRYECAFMLAHGAKCSIGDHLHPSAAITETTYDVIAPAYAEVAAKEPWCVDSRNVAEIAVLSVRAVNTPDLPSWDPTSVNNDADEGASRLLLEAHHLFDFVDAEVDFGAYRLVIVPDEARLAPALRDKLAAYVAAGGSLLLSGTSGLDPATHAPLFDIGGTVAGPSPFASDYAHYIDTITPEFVRDPLYIYNSGMRLTVTDGESLGVMHDPYFDRHRKHFNGHLNTPYDTAPNGFDAGVKKGRIAYLPHALFSIYYRNGAVTHRDVLARLIDLMLGETRKVTTSLPSGGRVTLRKQAGENRDVLHLLFAAPQLRGRFRGSPIEIIQDLPPIADTSVRLATDRPVRSVTLVPEQKPVPFEQADGQLRFTVDRLVGHQMVAIGY